MSNNSSYKTFGDSLGPTLPNGFDFTLLFEDSILSILPSTILLLVLPLRLFALQGKPRKVSKSILHENKLVSGSTF
jgi:ATP-binding cassette subfamily C (CFTR/MRP) protein 1